MMKVVEEEGTSMADFILYLKGEYVDAVYLQQDAFDPVDGATSAERQREVFGFISGVLHQEMGFESKDAARGFFQRLTQSTRDWNRVPMDDEGFTEARARLDDMLAEVVGHEVMSHA